VIPWLVFAVIVVPLVVVGFAVSRRKAAAGEDRAGEDAEERARIEQEFADAEAFEAKWREQDKERYHQERLP
jgi:flagellar basal body-associated protein FliL